MKKNELIKLLQEIPGNPDVVIWNGFVEDYHHPTKPEVVEFTRMKKELNLKMINMERAEKGLDSISDAPPHDWTPGQSTWDGNNQDKKKMVVLEMKSRNKKTYDRTGTIRY